MKKIALGFVFAALLLQSDQTFAKSTSQSEKNEIQKAEQAQDPFSIVEKIQLQNGIWVYLAQNKNLDLTSLRVEVDVGFNDEKNPDWGVSHLLEHVLFRDKELKDEMSYLQLIKEAGGEVNGQTAAKVTSYFGSIPIEKGEWLLENFAKMLLSPKISDEYVEKEKSTVELERGRPSPIDEVLPFSITQILDAITYKNPTFWEREFNLPPEKSYSRIEEQLSTRKLTAAQVQKHYDTYYNAQNMRIFIAGNFNRKNILNQLNTKWSGFRTGAKNQRPDPNPKMRDHPYVRRTTTNDTPSISIGTKLWQADLKDRTIVDSYMEYLAHRLMKEVRNKKGQTYTAYATTDSIKDSGYSIVHFETTKESFNENLALVQSYLNEEIQSGKFNQTQFEEARQLYLDQYRLVGKDANMLMWLAQIYYFIEKDTGSFISPAAILNPLSYDEYLSRLRFHFKSERSYLNSEEPPFFFYMDLQVFAFLCILLTFVIARNSMLKPFSNNELRWVRKVKYPPFKIVDASLFFVSIALYYPASYAWGRLWNEWDFLQSHTLLSQYLYAVTETTTGFAFILTLFAYYPSKLMVMKNHLVIKSKTYYSKHIQLQDIAQVSTSRLWIFPFPLKLWLLNVKHRHFYFDPFFWRPGLLIHLKSGKAYFFSISHPKDAARELSELVQLEVNRVQSDGGKDAPMALNKEKSQSVFKISS